MNLRRRGGLILYALLPPRITFSAQKCTPPSDLILGLTFGVHFVFASDNFGLDDVCGAGVSVREAAGDDEAVAGL